MNALKLAATVASFAIIFAVSLAQINLGTKTSYHPYDNMPASIAAEATP
jgi:hypothetical protein